MSDARRSLGKQAKELDKLLWDVKQAEWQSKTLDTPVQARKILGDDTKVTKWVLTEHSLTNLVEWNDLYCRYLRYFGQSEQSLPNRWQNLRSECDQFRQRVLTNAGFADLPNYLAQEWLGGDERFLGKANTEATVEELYHDFVQTDLQQRTARISSWEPLTKRDFMDGTTFSTGKKDNAAWQNLANDFRGREKQLLTTFEKSDESVQNDVKRFLRNYRHATLRVSWLEPHSNEEPTSLLFAIERKRSPLNSLKQFLDDILQDAFPHGLNQIVDKVLGRIADAVHEIGYDNFVKDLTSTDFLGGEESPLGSTEVNLIPGKTPAKCCPVLVGISRGTSKTSKLGFPKILQQVKVHLTECAGITRAVIVLSDTWDAKSFMEDHFEELRAHHRKGVRFLFLLIGAPDTSIADVHVMF